jgi:hypothetical protein
VYWHVERVKYVFTLLCQVAFEIVVLPDGGYQPVPVAHGARQDREAGDVDAEDVVGLAKAMSLAQYLCGCPSSRSSGGRTLANARYSI